MRSLPTTHPVAAATPLACIAAFAIVALAVHGLRDDLQWWRAPLSFYLVGDHGAWLRAAYVGLALALAVVGVQFRHALAPAARSALAPWLFGAAALALVVTAFAETPLPGRGLRTANVVHLLSAQTAFLTVTFAMLLQSWHLRQDPAWRHRFAVAFVLALACFAGLWAHTLVREWPRGLTQRGVILLVLAWLALAATWLRAAARAQSFAGAAGRDATSSR